ncbi:MAG TPA: hypothetical protein VK826_10260 [Bacteroidia bacterium]|nr:hypothetical protein [Bacteroidia bacterium]
MAVNTQLYLQPSLEIHLARSHSETSSQLLFLTLRNASAAAQARGWEFDLDPVHLAPADVVITSPSGDPILVEVDFIFSLRIIPGSVARGVNVITITHPTAGVISANVHVHDVLNDWWFGIDSITVPRMDINDPALPPTLRVSTAQVTIYGHFDADPANPNSIGVIADITGHDYISLFSDDIAIVDIDFRYNGWLQGVAVGNTTIKGRFTSAGTFRSIPVSVINWFGLPTTLGDINSISETNAILRLVGPRRGDPDEVPNMLFLAEGFLASEEPLFDRAVEEMKNRIFSAPRLKPFSYLRNDINVWKAFTPSASTGVIQRITSTTTIDTTAGFTVGSGGTAALVQQRDTFYGFCTPARPSDNIFTRTHHIVGDVRRYPLQLTWSNTVVQFLATLAEAGVPANRIGRHWYGKGALRGKDAGLVVILFNDRLGLSQEANYGYFNPIGLSLWHGYNFALTTPRPVAAADPDRFVWKVEHQATVFNTPALITANLTAHVLDEITDTTVHELGHSLVLGDEYEDSTPEISFANDFRFDNISYYRNINSGASLAPPQIDPLKLKWAGLHRISRSARINTAAWTHADLNNISLSIQVKALTGITWAVSDHVYLREFKQTHWPIHAEYGGVLVEVPFHGFIPLPTEDPRVLIEDLSIATVTTAAGVTTITMLVPKIKFPVAWQALADAAFRANIDAIGLVGGLLFLPRRRPDGSMLKLIDDEVMQFMNTTHTPLTSNFDASVASGCGPASAGGSAVTENPPATVTATSGRRLPLLSFRVVGAYEGADHATCRTYRPTGQCRMRDSSFNGPFCYVCQYLIVNRLNPSRLAELEADYPEFRP